MHAHRFVAILGVSGLFALAVTPAALVAAQPVAQVRPDAGRWPTWLLSSGAELRLGPPPDAQQTEAELDTVRALATQRDGAMRERIAYWDAGAPPYRWMQRTVKYLEDKGLGSPRAGRLLALMNVAIYDATIAAWDSKYTYGRLRPSEVEPGLGAIPTPASPSYPDERAVAAGAALAVLADAFPNDAVTFGVLANEAASSRVEAGVTYPSDVEAGLTLGRQVGERSVAWGHADGSDAVWAGTIPTGPGLWVGTNPVEPLLGTWKPWALKSGDQFRPEPRAPFDSEQIQREVAEVRDYPRTNLTNLIASFWEFYGGRAAFEFWNDRASQAIFEHHLDSDPPTAARIYATLNAAYADEFIACFDAKYAYWAARPAMLDPSIKTVFVTPNHPSYPAAHACTGGAMSGVMDRFFPADAATFDAIAVQEGEARVMGGIHLRSDLNAGMTLGKQVAAVVWQRAGGALDP